VKHSEAIRTLAKYGKRTYPKRIYGNMYKLVIETSQEPVGVRTTGNVKEGKKIYHKESVQKAIKELNIKLAQKLNL